MDRKNLKTPRRAIQTVCSVVLLGGLFATSLSADQHDMIEPDADKILTEMTSYLGALSSFSADFDTSTDIIQSDGQKLKLASSGSLVLQRPGKFRVKRFGTASALDMVLDAEQFTIHGMAINGYFQLPATTIDEVVETVRYDIGFDVPGADLMISKPLDMEVTDITSGSHIGMTMIGGDIVHHLAFRGDQVDWQIWIKDGDEPLPVKYVVTSKLVVGAPEYELLITNWNVNPQIDDTTFAFSPPSDAKLVTSVSIDATGNITGNSE